MKPVAFFLAYLLALPTVYADSATWNLNPTSGDWNTATNWTPPTIPNGSRQDATFDVSNTTDISVSSATEVRAIVFNSGASEFMITANPGQSLTLNGRGIDNYSGIVQNLVATGDNGVISFTDGSAGDQTFFTSEDYGRTEFHRQTNARNGTFTNLSGGSTRFFREANAGNGIFYNEGGEAGGSGGYTVFSDMSSARNGTFIANGTSVSGAIDGGKIHFQDRSTADLGTFTITGGSVSGGLGADLTFLNISTAGDSTITVNGGTVDGAEGGNLSFLGESSAGNATIIINGGVGHGGDCAFGGDAQGGTARFEIFGNGALTIASNQGTPVTVGSIEGDGIIEIDAYSLVVGGNNLSTVFSGLIESGGGLTKIGTGTLTLTGANTYGARTNLTTVEAGKLVISNSTGSGTGTGNVLVKAGTLGGNGIIQGAVTIGTGTRTGAFLAPAHRTNVQATLTIQSSLTFNADSTYACTFKARRNTANTDQVIANGVTINSGASFVFQGLAQGTLPLGLVLTVISNTSANPIAGTFSNLPDGGIVIVNGNNFQASYEGGDGNDLTLTVVP